MEKLETNIITPKRNTGENADIIEDLEIMAQSIQAEFNNNEDRVNKMFETTNKNVAKLEANIGDISSVLDSINGEVI